MPVEINQLGCRCRQVFFQVSGGSMSSVYRIIVASRPNAP
jgi:hypothetical protein